ncbi:MAG: DUF664 domain-containing protein [Chloroflexi bacterium]|nr:DUF664 domain-containing protein [Chloroflexota bacterium]
MPAQVPHGFPDTLAAWSVDDLLEVYCIAPERYREVIAGLTPEELTQRPEPGEWSVIEVVMHVADAEAVAAHRIRTIWAEPGNTLSPYNEDRWSRELRYNEASLDDLEDALVLFGALRSATTRLFRMATEADWQKACPHPEWGQLTLRNMLDLYTEHGERHIEQILAARHVIGRVLDYQVLITERLY